MSREQTTNEANVGGSELNVELDVGNGQIGESAKVDFETNIWSFQMPNGFYAEPGYYLMIKLPENAKKGNITKGFLMVNLDSPDEEK